MRFDSGAICARFTCSCSLRCERRPASSTSTSPPVSTTCWQSSIACATADSFTLPRMAVLRELRSALPALQASADDADRVAYARDLWPRHHLRVRGGRPADHRPEAIAWPTSAAELAQLVRWARGAGVPVVPFGAGSGVW